jgi:5'-3' exonuclease
MVELEADDALASAASNAAADPSVDKVCIWTPDKDLAQCVAGDRVVQVDRRTGGIRDEAGVLTRFGVAPPSIPDYLALVGDSADGYPGIAGWGPKSAAALLSRCAHLAQVPISDPDWRPPVAGGARLARSLRESWREALLFVDLATLRTNAPVGPVARLEWKGPRGSAGRVAAGLDADALLERAQRAAGRGG